MKIGRLLALPVVVASLIFCAESRGQGAVITPASVETTLAALEMKLVPEVCATRLLRNSPGGLRRYSAREFGSAAFLARFANYILRQETRGPRAGPAGQLLQLLANPVPLETGLDRWALENAGFRNGTLSRVTPLLAHELAPNGFMQISDYLELIEKYIFPLVDPHDLYLHLPSFIRPDLGPLLRKRAELSRRAGIPVAFDAVTPRTGKAEAQRRVLSFLSRQIRNYLHENWNFLTFDEQGVPHLFLQGIVALESTLDFLYQRPARAGLERVYLFSAAPEVRFAEYEDWPRWSEFARTRDGRDLSARLNAWKAQVEFSPPAAEAQRFEADFRRDFPERSEDPVPLLDRLAARIARDPRLARAMTYSTRVEVNALLLELCESYLNWTESN